MKTILRALVATILLYSHSCQVVAWSAERDAVVKIKFQSGRTSGMCSGVCVSSDGYILTAEHCVHNMKNGKITVLFGVKSYTARIVYDPVRNYTDEASLLKVNTTDKLPFSAISETTPKVGSRVHSIGFPDGKFSKSAGEIISISDKYIQEVKDRYGRKVSGTAYEITVNFGEAKGNSGGPLFNEAGGVIAISSTTGPSGSGWIGLRSIRDAMSRLGPPPLRGKATKHILYAFVGPGGT